MTTPMIESAKPPITQEIYKFLDRIEIAHNEFHLITIIKDYIRYINKESKESDAQTPLIIMAQHIIHFLENDDYKKDKNVYKKQLLNLSIEPTVLRDYYSELFFRRIMEKIQNEVFIASVIYLKEVRYWRREEKQPASIETIIHIASNDAFNVMTHSEEPVVFFKRKVVCGYFARMIGINLQAENYPFNIIANSYSILNELYEQSDANEAMHTFLQGPLASQAEINTFFSHSSIYKETIRSLDLQLATHYRNALTEVFLKATHAEDLFLHYAGRSLINRETTGAYNLVKSSILRLVLKPTISARGRLQSWIETSKKTNQYNLDTFFIREEDSKESCNKIGEALAISSKREAVHVNLVYFPMTSQRTINAMNELLLKCDQFSTLTIPSNTIISDTIFKHLCRVPIQAINIIMDLTTSESEYADFFSKMPNILKSHALSSFSISGGGRVVPTSFFTDFSMGLKTNQISLESFSVDECLLSKNPSMLHALKEGLLTNTNLVKLQLSAAKYKEIMPLLEGMIISEDKRFLKLHLAVSEKCMPEYISKFTELLKAQPKILSLGPELDTVPALRALLEKNRNTLLPKINFSQLTDFNLFPNELMKLIYQYCSSEEACYLAQTSGRKQLPDGYLSTFNSLFGPSPQAPRQQPSAATYIGPNATIQQEDSNASPNIHTSKKT